MDETEMQDMAIESARRFLQERVRPKTAEIDAGDEVPWELVKEMHALGLVGVTVEEEFGGLGASTVFLADVLEEIASVSPVLANINMVQSCYADFLVKFASEAMVRHWVPGILAGEKFICVAMTEAEAGSDIAGIRTTARPTGESFVLTGEKQYITLGLVADAAIVFAAAHDAAERKSRLSAYLVEADRPGFARGRKEQLMGMRGEATGSLVLDEVEIPASNRIGDAGAGFELAEYSFNLGRIAIGALALGIARACVELSAHYAGERQAFGRAIGKFQGVSFPIADNFARLEAARSIVHRSAAKRDAGAYFFADASIGKLLSSEAAMKAASDAVQILGGAGYTREYPAERFFRDAKLTQIYEGTNQIQRLIIGNYLIRGDLDPSYRLAL